MCEGLEWTFLVCDGKKPGFDGKIRSNEGFFPSFDGNCTRQVTGKPLHLAVFSRQNRAFSRHKQMFRQHVILAFFAVIPTAVYRQKNQGHR